MVKERSNKTKVYEKALIFIEDGSFSYDNRVMREARALVNYGWNVTVISPKYPGDPLYKKFSGKLRAYYYPKPTTESWVGHLAEFTASLFFGSVLAFYVNIRHGFFLFQACNPMDILWLIALPYKVLRRKFIFDQHDLVPELLLSRHFKTTSIIYHMAILLERFSYKSADAVISTNDSYRRLAILRGGKRPDDVFVVRNGPDLSKFRSVPPKDGLKKNGEILVGYLGNMNAQDGVKYLVEAARHIIKKIGMRNMKFIFIGGGSCQERLADMSKSQGLEDYVQFTGRIPDDDMLSTLCACDICVQPDPKSPLNDLSTMNKVLEYMALEKPVVAFDLKETRVSCGSAAIYAAPNDAYDLAEKILFLVRHKKLRQEMGKLGRTRVETELSWDFSIPKLLEAYRYVLRD